MGIAGAGMSTPQRGQLTSFRFAVLEIQFNI
jgi:hypothetical protein